jgi:hypothetical protein
MNSLADGRKQRKKEASKKEGRPDIIKTPNDFFTFSGILAATLI